MRTSLGLAQRKGRSHLTVFVVGVLSCLCASSSAFALSGASGQANFTYGPATASSSAAASAQNGTGMEAESKLFYTPDGTWWAVLGTDNPVAGVFLYRLNNNQWQQITKLPQSDPWMKADVLYDSAHSKLYVALRDSKSLTGNPRVSELYVYGYGSGGGWNRQSGPTKITTDNPRNLTITLDSQGRLWTTYETGGHIIVGHTQPGSTSFSYSNIPWSSIASNDTSVVASFGTGSSGFKVGVLWDDTITERYMFAWRNDSAPLSSAWNIETVYGNGVGGCPTATTTACANYHISLKTNGDDVYAAVKLMSQNSTNPLDPMIVVVHRDPNGAWTATTVSYKKQNASRQVLLLAPAQNRAYVIAESPKSGLFVWEGSLSSLTFNPNAYAQWAIPNQNQHEDPTSTKQPLGADGSGVVESSQGLINQYWLNGFSAL